MTLKKALELSAILVGSAFLLDRLVSPYTGGLNRWQDITLMRAIILAIPPIAAAVSLILGWRFNQRIVGISGFLASAIFFPIVPAFIAILIMLYTVTTKPLILTAAWTGFASFIAAIPVIYYLLNGAHNLLYAAGFGTFLLQSTIVSAIFLLISLAVWLCYLVKRTRT